jgi:hypothetical protein
LKQELIPPVIDGSREANPLLARRKRRIAKDLRWTRSGSLWDVSELAYLLHMLGRDDEALAAARFLGHYQFAGNFAFWTAVEYTLALAARLQRERGRANEAAACVRRFQSTGPVDDIGLRHCERNVKDYNKQGARAAELEARVRLAQVLCLLIELGGSKKRTVAELESIFHENAGRLREMVDTPGSAQELKRDPPARPKAQAKKAKQKQVRRPRKEK